MSVSTVHKLDKLVFPSSVEFCAINNARWQAGITSMIERPAGHVHPMFRANQAQKPVLDFSTPQLTTLLAAVGVGGAAMGSIATYFKLATATGNAARAAASHKRVTIPSSTVYWSTIRLPHNGRGEAQVMVTAVYDGVNDPFVYAGSTALSGNLTTNEFFGCGPLYINNVEIAGIQDIEISSGVQLIQLGASSEDYDTFVAVKQTEPVVTIKTVQAVNWGVLGLQGAALDGSDGLEFYARRYYNSHSRYANASAVHIYFQGLSGTAIPVDSAGQETSEVTDTLRCELIAGSDSVAPLTGTVNSAIT